MDALPDAVANRTGVTGGLLAQPAERGRGGARGVGVAPAKAKDGDRGGLWIALPSASRLLGRGEVLELARQVAMDVRSRPG